MMGKIFKFKQFEVDQSGCAMKINTDGVLLGTIVVSADPRHILDIGTGTGVIAMMLAQRYPNAFVDAVEIDESAAQRAKANFIASDFAGRTRVYHTPIALFDTEKKYDLIVSNPPYFVNDLKNPEERKGIARHADEQFFESLLLKVSEILAEDGCFWLILPVKQAEWVLARAGNSSLSPCRQIEICSDEYKPVIRQIICLSNSTGAATVEKETFYIYKSQGVYTDAYKLLLKDFFLAF